MGNKLIILTTKGSLWLGFIYLVITIIQYNLECTNRTLVYWSMLTIVMFLLHIIFRIGKFEHETSIELADIKLMIAMDDHESELKELIDLVEKADKIEKE